MAGSGYRPQAARSAPRSAGTLSLGALPGLSRRLGSAGSGPFPPHPGRLVPVRVTQGHTAGRPDLSPSAICPPACPPGTGCGGRPAEAPGLPIAPKEAAHVIHSQAPGLQGSADLPHGGCLPEAHGDAPQRLPASSRGRRRRARVHWVGGWTPPPARQDAAWPEPPSSSGHRDGQAPPPGEPPAGGGRRVLQRPPQLILSCPLRAGCTGVGVGVRLGGGCFWGHRAQHRGPCHMECSPGPPPPPPPSRVGSTPGPSQAHRAEPCARLLPPAPRSHTRRAQAGPVVC